MTESIHNYVDGLVICCRPRHAEKRNRGSADAGIAAAQPRKSLRSTSNRERRSKISSWPRCSASAKRRFPCRGRSSRKGRSPPRKATSDELLPAVLRDRRSIDIAAYRIIPERWRDDRRVRRVHPGLTLPQGYRIHTSRIRNAFMELRGGLKLGRHLVTKAGRGGGRLNALFRRFVSAPTSRPSSQS